MRILIINQPLNNRGDESAHRALVRRLNVAFPLSRLTIIFPSNSIDEVRPFIVDSPTNHYIVPPPIKKWYLVRKCLKFRLFWLGLLHPTVREIIKYIRNSDIVICAPGGICMGGFQDWQHMLLLKLTKFAHKPLIYWGRSIGPFSSVTKENRTFADYSREMLGYFSFLSLRDSKSQLIADELGFRYERTLDTAFLESPICDIPNEIKIELTDNYVIFVPNTLTWQYRYRDIPQKLIDDFWISVISLIAERFKDSKIVMLPQTYGKYVTDGYSYFIKIQKLYGSDRIYTLPDIYGSDLQQNIIAKSKFVIGARYHSIVFAVNKGVPFLSLSYEHKMKGMLETLNAIDKMVNIEEIFSDSEKMENALKDISMKLEYFDVSFMQKSAKGITENCFEDLLAYLRKYDK